MQRKPFYRSVTFWSLVATLLGVALAGIGRGEPILSVFEDPDFQSSLGQVLSALGVGGVLFGRARAKGPLTLKDDNDQGTGGGNPTLVLLALLLSGSLCWAAAGCGARLVKADRSVDVDIERGPPCVITVTADGEVASTVTGPNRCAVEVAP